MVAAEWRGDECLMQNRKKSSLTLLVCGVWCMRKLSKCLFYLILTFLSLFHVSSTQAGTHTTFGPMDYTRNIGAPVSITKEFSAVPGKDFLLKINNGGMPDSKSKSVASAIISLNGSGVVNVEEFIDAVSYIEKEFELDNKNTLAADIRGQSGGKLTIYIEGVDNDPPTIIAHTDKSPNSYGWYNHPVTVSFECQDDISGIASCSAPVFIKTDVQSQIIIGTAEDHAGNTSTTQIEIKLDQTKPNIVLDSPQDNSVVTLPEVTISGVVSDINAIDSFTINNLVVVLNNYGNFNHTITLVDGVNTILLNAKDVAGNVSTYSINITYEASPVSIHIDYPQGGSSVSKDSTVVFGTFEGPINSGVTVNGRMAFIIGNKFFVNDVPLRSGENEIIANLSTFGGSRKTGDVVIVYGSQQQNTRFSIDGDQGVVPLDTTFEISSINNTTIESIEVDFEGDGTFDSIQTGKEVSISNTYENAGLYQAGVRITDSSGNITEYNAFIYALTAEEADEKVLNIYHSMLSELRNGNVDSAVNFFTPDKRLMYKEYFNSLLPDEIAAVADGLANIQASRVSVDIAEFTVLKEVNGEQQAFFIYLIRMSDGSWFIEEL